MTTATACTHRDEGTVGHFFLLDGTLAQEPVDFGGEEPVVDRLRQRAVRPGLPGVVEHVLRRPAGHDLQLQVPARGDREDANTLIGRAHRADHLDAVAAGHEDVDQRDVGPLRLEHGEGLDAVGRFEHFVARVAQDGREDAPRVVVVVGHEDFRHGGEIVAESVGAARVIRQFEDLEARRAAGAVTLPDGHRLEVGQLHKVLWPRLGITKGALMRYYVRIAPLILPTVRDRPLVMRRYPDGVHAGGFYQQRAPADSPPGVRTAGLASDRVVPRRLVGGALITLLFTTQKAALSQDPWFSRVQSEDTPDHCVLDLDPMPDVSFATVVDVARWVRD